MAVDYLLDVPIHILDYEKVICCVRDWIASEKRPPATIVQTNAFSLVTAQEDRRYGEALHSADLSLPDGMPLVWLLRRKGHALKTRVYGPDLMLRLCGEAGKSGWRCFFYGGSSQTLDALRSRLVELFPALIVVGMHSPPFRALSADEERDEVAMINRTKPDILWVALGGPKQDIWMLRHRDLLQVRVMHGVGAAFDFIAGSVPQAPRWMMDAGLEWLFRLSREPGRLWKRYTLKNIKFIYYLMTREFLSGRFFSDGGRQ